MLGATTDIEYFTEKWLLDYSEVGVKYIVDENKISDRSRRRQLRRFISKKGFNDVRDQTFRIIPRSKREKRRKVAIGSCLPLPSD